jgi:hypothetical protein
MESLYTAELDIPKLNDDASKAHVYPAWPITLYFQLESCVTRAT